MKIKKVTVIGLGYVGLPILIESSKHYNSYGFDLNKKEFGRSINVLILI